MIPQSESRLRKAELEAAAAAEGTWRRRPTWRPTESSVTPDGPQTSVVTGRRDGARAERVSDWAEGRSWGWETWRVNMRTEREREREGCNRSGWDTDSLVFSAFCWLVWILASRSSAKASFVLRFCWVSVSSSVADDNLRRVLDFKTLQILIWCKWCVCVCFILKALTWSAGCLPSVCSTGCHWLAGCPCPPTTTCQTQRSSLESRETWDTNARR